MSKPRVDTVKFTIAATFQIESMSLDSLKAPNALVEKVKATLADGGAHIEVESKLGREPGAMFEKKGS